MGHFTQAHGTRQTRATLEGVQGAHARGGRRRVFGHVQPLPRLNGELRQQLLGLLLEDGEEVQVDRVFGIDVAVILPLSLRQDGRQGLGRQGFGALDGLVDQLWRRVDHRLSG